MFKWFSLSLFGFGVVTAYIIYNIFTIAQLFITPTCSSPNNCFKSFLHNEPSLDLHLFSSLSQELKIQDTVKLVDSIKKFSYLNQWERKIPLEIPKSVRDNGTFYMHFFIVPSTSQSYLTWQKLSQSENVVYFKVKLTQLHVPDSYIFNLLNKEESSKETVKQINKKTQNFATPVTHLKSKITINMLTDPMILPKMNVPQELYRYIRITPDQKFLPIVTYNFLETRLEDLKLMKNSTDEILLRYAPTYFGKFRFMVQLESTIVALKKMGFSARDIDDIKSFFASTNFYLLCITITISSFHLLFDFLAFKNDVKFWRNKSTMEGLSFRTVLWRAFSQAVILLYLLDEKASMIVLIPSGISTIIEFWKVMKVLRRRNSKETSDSEKRTNEYDEESMRYLSFLLYPLCIIGAIYSLIYQPHKSWYSWCIHSLVNCVYAFGFLFMLPQLFVNYRLKSVEALPWRAFMYKAFNTFIDDVFAFIITMPTAHRVACFRDDLIFLVYLYQRWLYPVDKTRVSESSKILNTNDTVEEKKEK